MLIISNFLLDYCYVLGAIYKYIATVIWVLKISSTGPYLLTRPRALEIIEPALSSGCTVPVVEHVLNGLLNQYYKPFF